MKSNFKIKTYWIFTFCMVFCSISTLFSQEHTDQELGFDVVAVTASLTERGVKIEVIDREITTMREMYKTRFIEMKRTEADFLQKIKNEQITTTSTSRLASTAITTTVTDIPQAEKDALQALYNSTNGANWTNHTGWDFANPVTSWDNGTGWFGVTVSNGHVVFLELYSNNLLGYIPDLSALTNLELLYLGNNNFIGTNIPSSLNLLIHLKGVILNNSGFVGTIPNLSALINLEDFNINNNNNLSPQNIPSWIFDCPKLVHLNMSFCNLTGNIPIEVGQLSKLGSMFLNSNHINGIIPAQIGLLSDIISINLDGNNLEGSIPSEVGLLSKLGYLYLAVNHLSGTIPTQIDQLTNLNVLWVQYNYLEGIIPDLTSLTFLDFLVLNQNKFRFVDFATQYATYKTQINDFRYTPQAKTDLAETITGSIGNSITLTMFTDNRFTPDDTFQWYKGLSPNGVLIPGATTRQYTLSNLSTSNIGDYYCISKHPQITNPLVADQNLILEREPLHLNVITCTPITGTLTINTAELCMKQSSSFSFTSTTPNLTYIWTSTNSSGGVVNTVTNNTGNYSFVFDSAGNYDVKLEALQTNGCKTVFSKNVTIDQCIPCDYCASFNLIKNEKYLVSAWVKEDNPATPQEQFKNFDKGCVSISFFDVAGLPIATPQKFHATGEIIDGWQRIIGEFVVPDTVDDMKLELLNESADKTAYFDDIRILPSKGNMKSFVYDQTTQRLMAELDENNYSTFYEYDLEGGLVRVKKETEKGVFTIQETRSGNAKIDNP